MTIQKIFITLFTVSLMTGCVTVNQKEMTKSQEQEVQCLYHLKTISERWNKLSQDTDSFTFQQLKEDTKNFNYESCNSNESEAEFDNLINQIIPNSFRNNLGLSREEAERQQGVFCYEFLKKLFSDEEIFSY